MEKTLQLMDSRTLLKKMGRSAYERGKEFTKEKFQNRVKNHFEEVMKEYCSV
jgi:hypothetical protein